MSARPKKEWDEGFSAGVLSALAVVHAAGMDTITDEIVASCGPASLIRHAEKDPVVWEMAGLDGYLQRTRSRKRLIRDKVRGSR